MNKVIPVLYTEQLQESINFYCDILGFECDSFEPDSGWVNIKKNGAEIMFSLPNEHLPFKKPTFTGSVYIKIENIDSLWNSIKEKVKISYPLQSFEYGMKEFAIHDNNGYLIQFGEEID
ncbi:bleomycin resistance family protein [Aquimarina sp. AD10]|uniref:VOC family protein n=1 Tax=Aquimarina sp. AD10 TaxID=1714849 RepID=UPI000E547996|nr:VOC family protein [Aquimarina sp. AD10]AXT62422.1 bleomycin resistance family protein [Aquimarina sp. AD10]RKM90383.1 bleomycin resistance family protein [Aquimarina sp. AD10]